MKRARAREDFFSFFGVVATSTRSGSAWVTGEFTPPDDGDGGGESARARKIGRERERERERGGGGRKKEKICRANSRAR
jgi:hypothetical protein